MMKKNKLDSLSKLSIRSLFGYIILSIIGGFSGFFFITVVNEIIAELVANGTIEEKNLYLISFISLIIIYFFSRRWLAVGIIKLSQDIYWNTRLDVVGMLIKAPYEKVKKEENEVYSTLTNDVANITQASLFIIDLVTSIVLIISSLVYMAMLSITLFIISLGIIILGILMYELLSKSSSKQFNRARDLEKDFNQSFNAILKGAKEINIDRKKGTAIYKTKTKKIAEEAVENNKKAYVSYLNSQLIGQLLFYILIAFILLYAADLFAVSIDVTISFVFVLLYILGPIGTVMVIIPIITRARISLKRMTELKESFRETKAGVTLIEDDKIDDFKQLAYHDIQFSFGDNKFGVGPIDFKLKKGEINFIYGGNGSGKTTFMNLLLTIYKPTNGTVTVNEEVLEQKDILSFKKLFAVVFGDFYLFDSFYGNENFDHKLGNEYLKLFEIEDKVQITETGFSTINLSTGQRKRLALIAALLEEKPILVLDEWAADQDPEFRRKFYTEIIPHVKKKGISVLAITHDDAYYNCADNLFKMEYGKLLKQDVRK